MLQAWDDEMDRYVDDPENFRELEEIGRLKMATATPVKTKKPVKTGWVYGSLENDEDLVNVLFYGDNGIGKTTDLASLAKLGKVVFIEAESGLKRGPLSRLGIPTKNLQLVRDTASEKQITFGKLKALCDQLRIDLADDPNAIAGVIFDSITEIQVKLLRQIMDKRIDRAFDKTGTQQETHKAFIEDYGVNTAELRDLIRMFRDLPCHVGLSATETRDEDDDGAIVYRPNLTPKIASDLKGYVDLVCYVMPPQTFGGKKYYLGKFNPGGKYQAKDRFGIMPNVLCNPTYDRVIAYVSGELTEKTDTQQQEWKTAREEAKSKKS